MDPSNTFIGTMAECFDDGFYQHPPEMIQCQSAPLSATDPLFDSSTVDFGQSRVAEVMDQPNGNQGIDERQLENRKPATKTTNRECTSSQPNVIRPQLQRNTTDQVTSLWPPSCADLSYNSDFPTGSPGSKPTQGNAMFRWMTTIKSKVNAIATILKSTPEETDHLLQRLTNGSKTCQNPTVVQGTVRSPNSSDSSLKVGSPAMCNKQSTGLISSPIQELETPGCLTKLQLPSTPPWNLSGIEKADLNFLESGSKVSTCQAPRESQTRSSDYLKKSSMNQHAQQISATTSQRAQRTTQQISATSELDLPQSGSEDEDEAWPTEGTNERIQAANELGFPQYPKTTPSADPVLLRTQFPANSANANEGDLPGPQSRDDDEDSSPFVQDLDLEDSTSCSNRETTTRGHPNTKPLTLSLGTRAHGSENLQRMTPASPTRENAKLTIGLGADGQCACSCFTPLTDARCPTTLGANPTHTCMGGPDDGTCVVMIY